MLKFISSCKIKALLLFSCSSLILIACGSNGNTSTPTISPISQSDSKPVANNDSLIVEEDSSTGNLNQVTVSSNDQLGNDGGDSDNYSLSGTAQNGTVTEISDGVFEYIPNYNYDGTDSFTYTLADIDGDTDTATVNITVNAYIPTAEDFSAIDASKPSFVSIDDTTPLDKEWVKLESMSDEFTAWDPSKWFKSTWNYPVPVFMSQSDMNSGVSNGHLWIKATENQSNPEGRWFQSARIHSRAETRYPMYTEARIKTSHISAYNTYWLNNGDIDNRDEIDIIENNSNPSCINCEAESFPSQMNSQYFQANSTASPGTIRNKGNFNRSDLSDANPLKNVNWNEDYHTYGVWWQDSKNIQFYLDGEPAGSVVVGEHENGQTYAEREFTRELEIIFDLWTNEAGYLGGLPAMSDLSDDTINTMEIDWVRTWKLEDR